MQSLTQEEKDKILWQNLEQLLGLEPLGCSGSMTLYLTPPAAPEAPFGIHKNGYIRVLRVAADTRLFEVSSAYISERITVLF